MRWLALCLLLGCGGKDDSTPEPTEPAKPTAPDADKQCVQLAKLCGDKSKHVDKMIDECKTSLKTYAAKNCADKAAAAYACYQRDLCGTAEKVWAIRDLGVLSERHNKCVTERSALRTCAGE